MERRKAVHTLLALFKHFSEKTGQIEFEHTQYASIVQTLDKHPNKITSEPFDAVGMNY